MYSVVLLSVLLSVTVWIVLCQRYFREIITK